MSEVQRYRKRPVETYEAVETEPSTGDPDPRPWAVYDDQSIVGRFATEEDAERYNEACKGQGVVHLPRKVWP